MADKDCKLIIENFPIGFIYLTASYNKDNEVDDFIVSSVNKEFEELFKIDRNSIVC